MMSPMGSARLRSAVKYIGLGAAMLCLVLPLLFGLPHANRSTSLHVPLRILPLGDSITWGWHPDFAQQGTNAYRARLHHNLVWAWYSGVDFVGTQRSGLMHDRDHEGHVGFTIPQIREAMGAALQMRPNMVLVHVGTSDLRGTGEPGARKGRWAEVVGALGGLLDEVLEVCPDAVVIVAKIVQVEDEGIAADWRAFNDAIPGVVEERRRNGFKLLVVDQSEVGVNELVDGVHPSFSGYLHMGDIWFQGIKQATAKGLITTPVSMLHRVTPDQ